MTLATYGDPRCSAWVYAIGVEAFKLTANKYRNEVLFAEGSAKIWSSDKVLFPGQISDEVSQGIDGCEYCLKSAIVENVNEPSWRDPADDKRLIAEMGVRLGISAGSK